IGETSAEIRVKGCLVSNQAVVECGADGLLFKAGTNEHRLLAAIAPDCVPITVEQLAELRIAWPMRLGHARPPEALGVGAPLCAGNRKQADFVWPCCQPEVPLGANETRPSLIQKAIECCRIERTACAIDKARNAVLFGF